MKILVVEDKQMHRDAALETLAGHDVTVVRGFDEAMKLLQPWTTDEATVDRLLVEAGFPEAPGRGSERIDAYMTAKKAAYAQARVGFSFDAVLTDMMMPMSRDKLAPGIFRSQEQVAYGFIIALRAAQCGAKFVAMLTDTNHHQGAMSAALDHLSGPSYQGCWPLQIDGAKVVFVHAPFIKEVVGKKDCTWCKASGVCSTCGGTKQATDWEKKTRSCWSCSVTDQPPTGVCRYCEGTRQEDDVRHERKDWGQVLKDLIASAEAAQTAA